MAESDAKNLQQGQSAEAQSAPAPITPIQVPQQVTQVLPQQAVPQVQTPGVQPSAPVVSIDQAKMAADQLAGGLQQGFAQLQQTGVAGVFKTAENQPKVTKEDRLWAGVSYIPLVALVALISMPESSFVKLHARQGLLIFIFFFFCLFVLFVPFIGPLFGGLIQFALFILGLFSMYQAFIGNWWKIPMLGEVAEMIPVGILTKVSTDIVTGQPAPQEPAVSAETVVNQPSGPIQTQQTGQAPLVPPLSDQAPPVNK